MVVSEIIETGTQIGTLAALAPFLKEATPLAVKVIDTVSKGIGTVYSPINTYLNEKAQIAGLKDVKKLLEETPGDIIIKKGDFEVSLSNTDIGNRAITTTINKSVKEQINIDEIVAKSVSIIEAKIDHDYEKISKEEVSEDWALRFFDISKNIRDEEMKNLWSSILADEIVKPGSYSLRALEILKNMNRKDAELFTKICNLALDISDLVIIPQSKEMLDKYDISFIDSIYLEELNLLQRDLSYFIEPNKERFIMFGDKRCIIVKNMSNTKVRIGILKLTNVGKEIYKLTNPTFDLKNLKEICKGIQQLNNKLEVYYTDATMGEDGKTINYNSNLNRVE